MTDQQAMADAVLSIVQTIGTYGFWITVVICVTAVIVAFLR